MTRHRQAAPRRCLTTMLGLALLTACGDASTVPGGSRLPIAYGFNADGLTAARNVYVTSEDGKVNRLLVDLGGDEAYPAWAPDGRTLLIAQDRGAPLILLLNEDGTGVRPIPGVRGIARWSPDGAWIAFGDYASSASFIDVMRVDGTARDTLVVGGVNENLTLPSWTTGGRIAFNRNDSGFVTRVWTMKDDGSELTRITSGASDVWPAWSPDGSRIAYLAYVPGANGYTYQLTVTNADGANPVQLTHDETANFWAPTWSPDGRWILVERRDAAGNGCGFVKVPATGGEPQTVVPATTRSVCGGASWR